jgi:hypothetical protein
VLSSAKKLSPELTPVLPASAAAVASAQGLAAAKRKRHCRAGGEKKRRWCWRVARLAEARGIMVSFFLLV